MGQILDLRHNLRKYFTFKAVEIRGLILTSLLLGFVISFRSWGIGPNVDVYTGMRNLINAFLIVALAVLVRETARKIVALAGGMAEEFQLWFFGLLIALVVSFLTQGRVWWLSAGGFLAHHIPGLRLGFFRYDVNYWTVGIVALAGPVANILLALVFRMISFVAPTSTIELAITFNVYFAVFNMLPLPPLDGLKVWYGSRMLYGFAFPLVLAMGILIKWVQTGPIVTLVLAGAFAFVSWLAYWWFRERHSWQGGEPR